MGRQKNESETKAWKAEQQHDDALREINRLKEKIRQQSDEIKETQQRLAEVEKNADLDRRDQQIMALEAELQTTRRTMKERWKKEVDQLRQELVDYVRFIVHILPENWAETEAYDKVPPDL